MKLTGSEYEAIVEASPNMIWRAGLDANCNYFNVTCWHEFTGKNDGAGSRRGLARRRASGGQRAAAWTPTLRRLNGARAAKWNTGSSGTTDYGVGSTTAACRRSTRSTSSPATLAAAWTLPRRLRGRKLIDLAHYDTLTSVFNRNYLEILIDFESQKSQKELYPLSVILIDVDNFKYFNDQYGHDFGDKVLSSVAALMSGKLRERLYRPICGDNFLILLPRTRRRLPVLHSGFWTRCPCSTSKIPLR